MAEYDQVRIVGRFEMLQALIYQAPASIGPAVKRASELGRGSVEDHASSTSFLATATAASAAHQRIHIPDRSGLSALLAVSTKSAAMISGRRLSLRRS